MDNIRKILLDNTEIEYFRCPHCFEHLSPQDVEIYPRCPYCDELLPRDAEMEDFILSPVAQQWERSQLKDD